MGKLSGSTKADVQANLVFQTVTKEVGEGDDKKTFTLKYDPETERFDFSKDGSLLISSCSLKDCFFSAEENKVPLSEEEKKISFKIVK